MVFRAGADPRLAHAFRTLPKRRRRWREVSKGVQLRWVVSVTAKVVRAGCVAAIIFGIVAAIYLTDRRSSDLETIPWLPVWLHGIAQWADYHGRFRNVPAYGILALPVLVLCSSPRRRGNAVVALATFATVMEYTQLLIPTRFFDWYDILESWAGIIITWILVEACFYAERVTSRPGPKPEVPTPELAGRRRADRRVK
jgi:hypothetical protein